MNRQVVLAVSLVALMALITVVQPRFLTAGNFVNVADQASIIGLVAVGMTFVMISGGIDLSVGSVLALGGFISAVLFEQGVPTPIVVVAALVGGAIVGAMNGYFIAYRGIPPLIMTLAMLYMVRGGILFLSGGETIGLGFPPEFRFLAVGTIGPLPMTIVITGFVYALAYLTLSRLRFGRYTVAIGTDDEASQRAGIRVRRQRLTLYVMSGGMASLAGIVLAAKLNAATTTAGTGAELTVIAAVVIGGTSLFGGRGSVVGTLLGVLFLAVVNNGLNLLGVSPFLQQFSIGLLLLTSVIVYTTERARRR